MKQLVSLLTLLAGSSVLAVTSPTVTVTPQAVKHGDTVTISVQMRGNTSTSKTFPITMTCQYYDEGANNPTVLPPVSIEVTLIDNVGAPVKSPSWDIKLPPTWTMASNPINAGYLAPQTNRTDTGLSFVATLLPPDTNATTTWTMYVP